MSRVRGESTLNGNGSMMYEPQKFRALVGDGYVRCCMGIESEAVDVKVVRTGDVTVELGNWMEVVG